MSEYRRIIRLGTFVASALVAASCGDDGDCSTEIERARQFLAAHRECTGDEDCTVVSTGCHTYANGICGQAPLNREAAASDEWRELAASLDECLESCPMCAAALVIQCRGGLCGDEP